MGKPDSFTGRSQTGPTRTERDPRQISLHGGNIGQPGDGMRQFYVESVCPIDSPEGAPDGILPVVVWVDLNRQPLLPFDAKCMARKYFVPTEQAAPIRAKAGRTSPHAGYTVCEHMGHLIE